MEMHFEPVQICVYCTTKYVSTINLNLQNLLLVHHRAVLFTIRLFGESQPVLEKKAYKLGSNQRSQEGGPCIWDKTKGSRNLTDHKSTARNGRFTRDSKPAVHTKRSVIIDPYVDNRNIYKTTTRVGFLIVEVECREPDLSLAYGLYVILAPAEGPMNRNVDCVLRDWAYQSNG
jgi:hypothetical protein